MTQNTEQNVRTRDEQIAALMGVISPHDEYPHVTELLERHILEAEARGAEEQRRKDAALTRAQHFLRDQAEAQDRLPERDDIKKWQEDQSEFFTATILEIVCEYATWRDARDAEGQDPVAWQWLDAKSGWLQVIHDDPAAHAKEMEEMGIACRPVYLGSANVAALEADIASLKEAEQLARADAEASKARVKALEEAFGPLLSACEAEMIGDATADCTDEEGVSTSLSDDGTLHDSPITFGHLRRARAALTREGGV